MVDDGFCSFEWQYLSGNIKFKRLRFFATGSLEGLNWTFRFSKFFASHYETKNLSANSTGHRKNILSALTIEPFTPEIEEHLYQEYDLSIKR